MIEGQESVEWQEWLSLAKAAEAAGLDGLFRSDHYTSFHGAPGAALDAWSTITALAPLTQRIRLGTLVSPVTFRHPSIFARMVASADHISGGRIDVGMGSGWHQQEHEQNGFPFPELRTRYDLLEEHLEIVTRSWSGEMFDHNGRHYTLRGQRALPTPVQKPHPPIILGGQGKSRSMALAIKYASEYNMVAPSIEECRNVRQRFDDACRQARRDPTSLALSMMTMFALGDTHAAAQDSLRRARAAMPKASSSLGTSIERLVGTVDEVAEKLREYERAGISRVFLNHFDRSDLHAVELMGQLAKALA
jgi:F420-dependent oxidoreductase-like protein